ncbi:MAG: hypothetical protein GF333_00060 [Candidatus Omnitrophica bacterium]|nr:hypothetical protein [Candidatus Omnitrophota bacterium]
MVKTSGRIFFIIGKNSLLRQRALRMLRKNILHSRHSAVSVHLFYAKEIDLFDLQEKAFTYAFEQEKILVFKDSAKLPAAVKKFMCRHRDELLRMNYLIFDVEEEYLKFREGKKYRADEFFKTYLRGAKVYKAAAAEGPLSLDDLKHALRKKDSGDSFFVLERLLREEGKRGRELGPQILGMLVYESMRASNPKIKEACFSLLWDTDRALKETGIENRLIIERCLAKWLSLFQA